MILILLASSVIYLAGALMTYRTWHQRGKYSVSGEATFTDGTSTKIPYPSLDGWDGWFNYRYEDYYGYDTGDYHGYDTGRYFIPVVKRICFFLWIPLALIVGFREIGKMIIASTLFCSKGPSLLFDIVTPKSNLMLQMPIIQNDKYLLEAVNEVESIAPETR